MLNGGEPTEEHEVTKGALQADSQFKEGAAGPLEQADPTKILAKVVEGFTDDIAVHFWDFGGQMMTHATHQFFLRARCLYVIVIDGRNRDDGNADAEYWLSYLHAFAGDNTPVLIVGNKADASPVEVDLALLKKRHGHIVEYHKLSCAKREESQHARAFEGFLEQFKAELAKLAGMGSMVKSHAEAMIEADQMLRRRGRSPVSELVEIFAAKSVEAQIARDQLAYFDLLGVVVWFQDRAALADMVFSPAWITNGVYSVLYSDAADKAGGRLTAAEFHRVLDDAGQGYTAEDKRLMMEAMKAFKTAFVKKDRWIVPAILPVKAASHTFDTSHPISVRLRFDAFLPPQLLSQLICERQGEIVEDAVWRAGVHLRARGGLVAEALLLADHTERSLRIDVSGRDAQVYLGVLQDAALGELEDLPELEPKVKLRLAPAAALSESRGTQPEREEWAGLDTVLNVKAHGQASLFHGKHVYDLKKVFGDAPTPRGMRKGEVFLSYARRDIELLKRFDKRLYYANVSTWWDDALDEGKWRDQIDRKIDEAQALIVVWTPLSATREQVRREVDLAGADKVIHVKANGLEPDAHLPEYADLNLIDIEDDARLREALAKSGVTMRSAPSPQPRPVMRGGIVDLRADRDDAGRIDCLVAGVIVALDVLHVHRLRHARLLIEIAHIAGEVRIVGDAADIAFEMADIDRIEPQQRRKQPPVRLGDRGAGQIAPRRQPLVQPVERLEERADRLLIGVLRGGEAGFVDAVIDRVVNSLVQRIDLFAQQLGIIVSRPRPDRIERAVEHAYDLRGLVGDDRVGLLVPQHRHRDPARIGR